ncbi:MAG TPA: VOC family protein [Luteibaculaceae bacterium]|nr:VOC family protein [Luteibaculaceae bacterium]
MLKLDNLVQADVSVKTCVSGIQQVGIGVDDASAYFLWLKTALGFDVPIFDDRAPARLMTRYTGGEIHARRAILSMNLSGGGGAEIWQYTSREPQHAEKEFAWSDCGISAVKIKTTQFDKLVELNRLEDTVSLTPLQERTCWISDPYGNFFQIIESAEAFQTLKHPGGGVCGAVITVSDMDRSLAFYQTILGSAQVRFDEHVPLTGFPDSAGEGTYRRVLLHLSNPNTGAFSKLLGDVYLELIQPLWINAGPSRFENRFWGDFGFIHLCLDVTLMSELKAKAGEAGYNFTVDSDGTFDMGESGGRFCYVEDPDRTLIELVETHKVPILKKWGWYLHLNKRKQQKPLPKWMIKAMGWGKIKI